MDRQQFEKICQASWYPLLCDGCTMLYRSAETLEGVLNELEEDGFSTHYFDALDWNKDSRFDWDYMKRFNDGHAQYSTETYHKTLPDGAGYAFVFKHFDLHYFKNPLRAMATLQTIKDMAWLYMVFGKKLLVFLEISDDSFNQHLHENGEKPIRVLEACTDTF